jgi:phage gp36-like protein
MASTAAVQYASIDDLKSRVSDHDLKDLSDEDGQEINEDKLNAALLDASREIDSSLATRYALPLDPTAEGVYPDILIRICCDIALYRLQGLRPLQNLEDTRVRYKDARDDLKSIRSGGLQLGVDPVKGQQPAVSQPTTQLDNTPRFDNVFSRSKLRNY